MKKNRSTEDQLYWLGIYSVVIMLIGMWGLKKCSKTFFNFQLPCVFRMLTGYYCPGCGGTRAVKLFLKGKIIKSFIYHPVIPYLGIGGGIFLVCQTLHKLTRGKVKGMRFHNSYVYIMGVILIIQFFVKNALLYFWGYYLI